MSGGQFVWTGKSDEKEEIKDCLDVAGQFVWDHFTEMMAKLQLWNTVACDLLTFATISEMDILFGFCSRSATQ